MTKLSRAKNFTKSSLVVLGGLLVLLIIARIIFAIFNFTLVTLPNEQQAALPTVDFGQLPPPVLQPATINSTGANIQLDLVSGQLPQSTASAKVFLVAKPVLTLSAQDRARARAAQFGFTAISPTQPNPTTFAWDNGSQKFAIDLASQTFTLTADPAKLDMSNRQNFTYTNPLPTSVGDFAQNLVNYADLQYQSPLIEYVTPVGAIYTPQPENATDLTNYGLVSFYRQPLDNLPIYSAKGKFGPLTMVLVPPHVVTQPNNTTPSITLDQLAYLSSSYFPIDQNSSGTYPLITPQAAFTQLQQNLKSYLVSVEPATATTPPTVFKDGSVLFVTLVYLEPDTNNQQFVQPAWMFEGRANTDVGTARWTAYVPAVDQAKTAQLLAKKK